MTQEHTVWLVVPEGIDDPERVSGGNVYDRHVRDGLRERGWLVKTCEVADAAAASAALAAIEAGGVALVDGLVAGWIPAAIETAAARAHVVVVAHMVAAAFPDPEPGVVEGERRSLTAASHVVATSTWAADELVRRGLVPRGLVAVATPGSREPLAPAASPGDRELLCVGVVARHKGQDLLLDALEQLRDLDWTCTIAGSRSADPVFAARIASAASRFDGRVRLPGVLDGRELELAYQRAGVLVAPSRAESFGMAIADARRRGLPVVAAAVGGIPDTLAGGGALFVPGDDADALADALRRWMTFPVLRSRLRSEAATLRFRAPRWDDTISRLESVLRAA